MLNFDAVVWGSILSAVLSGVIVIYLGIKVKGLMDKDAESHKE
jgi:hypothetical protein